jgi:aspartokinase
MRFILTGQLKRNGDLVAVLKDMAIVSIVGSEMRNMIGMAVSISV